MRKTLIAAALALGAAPAMADTTLTVATHYTDAQLAPLTACFRAYETSHPGIHIVHQQSIVEDYLQTVLTSRIGGTSPDIYNVYSAWSAQLADAGVLDTPPAEIARTVDAGYLPSTIDAIKVAGRTYGIPTEISAYMLVYNKKLFREAGIAAPPRDWDEVVADAAKITKRNAQGKIVTAGYAFGPSVANGVHPFLALLQSRGVAPFKPNLQASNLAGPEAVAVLADETKLFAQGITDNTIQVRDFPSGSVGMMIFANWYKDTLRQAFGAALDDTVGIAPIPGGENWRTLQYAFFWGVDANSPHRREAWSLLSWLNAPQGEGKRSCTGDMLVKLGALTGNRADIAATPEYGDAFSKPYVDAISSGRAVAAPNVLRSTEIQQTLRAAIGRAWSGAQPPDAALREADAKITALLNDRS